MIWMNALIVCACHFYLIIKIVLPAFEPNYHKFNQGLHTGGFINTSA